MLEDRIRQYQKTESYYVRIVRMDALYAYYIRMLRMSVSIRNTVRETQAGSHDKQIAPENVQEDSVYSKEVLLRLLEIEGSDIIDLYPYFLQQVSGPIE